MLHVQITRHVEGTDRHRETQANSFTLSPKAPDLARLYYCLSSLLQSRQLQQDKMSVLHRDAQRPEADNCLHDPCSDWLLLASGASSCTITAPASTEFLQGTSCRRWLSLKPANAHSKDGRMCRAVSSQHNDRFHAALSSM